jgi:hypothetical protein
VALFGLLALALSASAAVASPLKDYKGTDGGWLVFSVSTDMLHFVINQGQPDSTSVTLKFRRVGETTGDSVRSMPSVLLGHSDFSGELDDKTRIAAQRLAERWGFTIHPETYNTQVFALRMAPGDYEIYWIQIDGSVPGKRLWETLDEHVLPFRIEGGRAIYLGALTPVPLIGKNFLGFPTLIRWVLITDDQHDRDLTIARRNSPDIGPVDYQRDGQGRHAAQSPTEASPVPEQGGPPASEPANIRRF